MVGGVLIFGFHPVREALHRRPECVRRVLVADGRGGGRRRELEGFCRRHGVTIERVPREHLDALAEEAPHNGFVAELAPTEETEVPAATGDPNLLVLVEDVQDPRNLGALLRVCEGAGVGRVMIRDRGSAPISPAAVKTSAGAAEWMDVDRVTNSSETIRRLKDEGYWVYGTEAGGKAPWEIDLGGKILLVFGGEEKGMRRLTRDLCDDLIGLPMRGRVASLNLATASAAVIYEALRQRETSRAGEN
jgi:23S rRNA (guanosine2251-2'-O)-methyltransferase